MSRCRENAGILFARDCSSEAGYTCGTCQKPVCSLHARQVEAALLCMSCARQQLVGAQSRASFAHLRDDPYFFWYASQPGGLPFTTADRALFAEPGPEEDPFAGGSAGHWRGS